MPHRGGSETVVGIASACRLAGPEQAEVIEMQARERALQMALAEAAMHVHELGGDNMGPRIQLYQAASSVKGTGFAWCDAFCDFCFVQAGRPLQDLESSALVDRSFALARQKGWLVTEPARGDLVCFQWPNTSSALDHIGFVVQPQPDGSIKTVEGNTSPMAGTGLAQGEGDGVYVKTRPRSVCAAFIRVPGDVPDPHPPAGYKEWAAWVQGGRKGKRPDVPQQIPRVWWAKLGDKLHAPHDPHPPHHVLTPAH